MSSEKAPIVNTQQLSKKMPSISRQRSLSAADIRLPGERLIKKDEGMVREGTFKVFSEVMDSMVGNSNETMDLTVMQEPGL